MRLPALGRSLILASFASILPDFAPLLANDRQLPPTDPGTTIARMRRLLPEGLQQTGAVANRHAFPV